MMRLLRSPEMSTRLIVPVTVLLLAVFFSAPVHSAGAAEVQLKPRPVSKVLTDPANAVMRLKEFLGIPYRDDGALDYSGEPLLATASGRYTLFADQSKTFSQPGLNCSGFVLAASEKLLNKSLSLDEAKKDRKGDSGPGSPYGEDWDFGLDLILNIAAGREARVMLPEGRVADPATLDGRGSSRDGGSGGRGFVLQDRKAWADILPRLRYGKLYLWALSRVQPNKSLQYHHVGLILAPDAASGKILLYHAARNVGVNRVDLKSKDGLENFLKRYKDTSVSDRHIYLLEVDMAPNFPQ